MEKIKLDEETIKKLKECEEKVLRVYEGRYSKSNELTLDDFYSILDEVISEYEDIKDENSKLKTEIFYGISREDDYE